MYCPPESGNIDPSSAKAKAAHIEISAPNIQTRKNRAGWGRGPAISFAVRKIDEPIMPPASNSTESSKESPRTRLGLESVTEFGDSDAIVGDSTFIRSQVRLEIPTACHSAGKSQRSSHRR